MVRVIAMTHGAGHSHCTAARGKAGTMVYLTHQDNAHGVLHERGLDLSLQPHGDHLQRQNTKQGTTHKTRPTSWATFSFHLICTFHLLDRRAYMCRPGGCVHFYRAGGSAFPLLVDLIADNNSPTSY